MEEIDPQMFITCRLCLQHTGSYQIVPLIQHQIKYCFDINVQPFDLLPQLICKECKHILGDFFATKQRFVELQNNLQRKHYLPGAQPEVNADSNETSTQQDTVSSSQKNVDDNDSEFNRKLSMLRRKKSRLSSGSSDNRVLTRSASPADIEVKKKKRSKSKSRPKSGWEEFYKKHYKCTICTKEFKKRNHFQKHLRVHSDLLDEHKNTFARHCTVPLQKLDEKPNLTGMTNSIVFDETRIQVENVRSKYCIVYKQRLLVSPNNDSCEDLSRPASACSDGDAVTVRANNRKRCRIESASSNDTIVLNKQDDSNDENGPSAEKSKIDLPCINIDDSSNAGSVNSGQNKSKTASNVPNVADYKVIQNLVCVSYARYMKKIESANKDVGSESHIKQKILNMGRKIVTKQGIICTGLLRFMEHENLNIKWIQTTPTENSSEQKDKIHITMKLKEKPTIDKKLQWTVVEDIMPASDDSEDGALSHHNDKKDVETESKLKSILLNECPVLNPKQLPKKTQPSLEVSVNENDDITILDSDQFAVNEMCLPKITSTTSLAAKETPNEIANSATNLIVAETTTMAPVKPLARIKVKPASELMSQRVLQNFTQVAHGTSNGNVWANTYPAPNQNHLVACYTPISMANVTVPSNSATVMQNNYGMSGLANTPALFTDVTNHTPPQPTTEYVSNTPALFTDVVNNTPSQPTTEYVVLDSPDLPNIRTPNPIAYISDLLSLHHITFMNANDPVTPDFTCLIKFKIQYNQENKDQPVKFFVTFSCSVSCMNKRFHLGVRHNALSSNIDLSTLSASWQWEIINKIYDNDVAEKMLRNAHKVNMETYESTNLFLCLLKSITLKKT